MYRSSEDYPTQMRKRTQKAVDNMSPQVQSEMVRPYKSASYQEHEYNQTPPPGIDPWPDPILPIPIPFPDFRIPTPIFIPSPGTYYSYSNIQILCSIEGADIYYTTNGSQPTERSKKYTGPIEMADNLLLIARAFKDGYTESNIASGLYRAYNMWLQTGVIYGIGGDFLVSDMAAYDDIILSAYPGGPLIINGNDSDTHAHVGRSKNGGLSWTPIVVMPGDVGDTPDPTDYGTSSPFSGVNLSLVALSGPANDRRIYKSTDKGTTWSLSKQLTDTEYIYEFYHAIEDDVYFFCIKNTRSIYKSSDSGATWTLLTIPVGMPTGSPNISVIFYDNLNKKLYAGTYDGYLIVSSDNGTTWTDLGVLGATIYYIQNIVHDFVFDNLVVNVFTDAFQSRLYVSDDGGTSWSAMLSLISIFDLVYDNAGESLFTVWKEGEYSSHAPTDAHCLSISEDGGATWSTVKTSYTAYMMGLFYDLQGRAAYMLDDPDLTDSIGETRIFRLQHKFTSITQPAVPVVSGTTPTTDTTPTWSWTATGDGWYRYKLDDSDLTSGATITSGQSYTPAAPLSIGSHTLYVQACNRNYEWSASGSFAITIEEATWTVHLDNSDWSPTYGTWDTNHWNSEFVAGREDREYVYLLELGTWVEGYRPIKIRVSHTCGSPVVLVGDEIYSDAYTSGTELDITITTDMTYLVVYVPATAGAFTVTNIEFGE